jgi:Transposase DDE domain group 1
MATPCIAQLTFRYQGFRSPLVARFDVPHASSDGGLVLLKAVDDRLRLTEAVAQCVTDPRQPGKVAHSILDLVRQRVFGLAAGYLDGNDAARVADDPLHKLVLDREPLTGPALGSQPTLSRFENAVGRRELVRAGHRLAQAVIAHHRRRLHGRARRITIDLDPTDDPTHGQQELSFFNGHYDTACYLPLVATLTFDDEPIQFLAGIVLRPGNAPAGRGAIGRLRWLLRALRGASRVPRCAFASMAALRGRGC